MRVGQEQAVAARVDQALDLSSLLHRRCEQPLGGLSGDAGEQDDAGPSDGLKPRVHRRPIVRWGFREGPQRQLTMIGQELDRAAAQIEGRPQDAAHRLELLVDQANITLTGLRDLARGIFPPLLAEQGVVAALEAHVRKVGANATIEASASFTARRFDADAEACVYFCCLQAIQNVLRHAANAPCTVRLDASDDAVVFEVADPGPGFDVRTTPRGMGLSIMQDRVDALDGELTIDSSPGRGTTVTGRLPARGASVG